jgi:hypothetical protein
MKKTILLAIFMIAAGSLLNAQNAQPGNAGKNKCNSAFVDANKNKLCDNFESNTRKTTCKATGRFVKGNGNNGKCVSRGGGRRNNTCGIK